jgi:two-component system, OmpR family, response regulator
MLTRGGKIVVVDDDPIIRQMVTSFFIDYNFPTASATNGLELRRYFEGGDPSLIILDLQLEREDGLDLLKEIRSRSDVPVIIVTGHCLDEADRILGLELGADDYIAKPFSVRELLARVKAVLRRQEIGRVSHHQAPDRGGYRFDGWTLERRNRKLFNPEGEHVRLSKGEYAFLLAFLQAPQRVLTREHLLQSTRLHEDIFDRSIDVQVRRLRRKLERDPRSPKVIRTVRGVGYNFTIPVEPL